LHKFDKVYLSAGDTATTQGESKMQNNQVIFKGKMGSLWIKAEVVKKVEGGYILSCGSTKGFFVEEENVKEVAA